MTKPPMDSKVQRPFDYVPACDTDIRRTLRRVRARMQAQQTVQVPPLVVEEIGAAPTSPLLMRRVK